jgi:hypothetical protein
MEEPRTKVAWRRGGNWESLRERSKHGLTSSFHPRVHCSNFWVRRNQKFTFSLSRANVKSFALSQGADVAKGQTRNRNR